MEKQFDKKFELEVLDVVYQEAKDGMRHVTNTTDALDRKAHGISAICIAIFFAVCGFIFTKNNPTIYHIIPCSIIFIGGFISMFLVYLSYKPRSGHIFGDTMEDVLTEDSYYHDNKGIKIYLIDRYAIKIKDQIKINNLKAGRIKHAMTCLAISGILYSVLFLLSLSAASNCAIS